MTKVDLITGFLGAGKTTFIQAYGAFLKRRGIRFAVIENEFGAAGVDSATLSQEFESVTELAGGCICCTLKTGLHQALARLSGQYDRILVEPSGIFNMDDFYDVVNSPTLSDTCQMGIALTIVDPHSLKKMPPKARTVLACELVGTGCVVWSKTDLQPACQLTEAEQELTRLLADEIVLANEASVCIWPISTPSLTDEEFVKLMNVATPVIYAHKRMFIDHTTIFQSCTFRPRGVYTMEHAQAVMGQILADKTCGNIMRIKGFVAAKDGSISINCTTQEKLFTNQKVRHTMLNFIGYNLARDKIQALL